MFFKLFEKLINQKYLKTNNNKSASPEPNSIPVTLLTHPTNVVIGDAAIIIIIAISQLIT